MMSQIIPLRPTIIEAAHNIAAKFAQADRARDKARSMRVEIGEELNDLQRRIEAGEAGKGVEFWVWIKQYCLRSVQDMRKCMKLARAENPEAAADEEREDTRKRVRKVRAKRAYSTRPAQVVKFDPVARAFERFMEDYRALTPNERERLLAQIREACK